MFLRHGTYFLLIIYALSKYALINISSDANHIRK